MSFTRCTRSRITVLLCFVMAVAGCTPAAAVPAANASIEVSPTSVPQAAQTQRPDTPAPATSSTPEVTTWASDSPDGQWSALGMMRGPFAEDDGEKYHAQLKVVSSDGRTEWTVIDETLPFGLGYTTPQVFKWSNDGRHLYYTNLPVPDGCAIFINAWGLYRVDLTDGQAMEIAAPGAWWLSLSPDETRLASVTRTERGLDVAVHDLQSGDERQAELDAKYAQAGNIVWSPDQSAIVLAADQNPCSGPDDWTRSIIQISVDTLSQKLLLGDASPDLGIEAWPEAGRVTLIGADETRLWLNVASGEVTAAE